MVTEGSWTKRITKLHCQNFLCCLVKNKTKQKTLQLGNFLNVILSLMSFFKIQVRIWENVQLDHNYPEAIDKNLKFQASTRFKTIISPWESSVPPT